MHIQKLSDTPKEKASHEYDMSMLYKQVLFCWDRREKEIRGRLSMFNFAVLKPSGYFTQYMHGSNDPEIGMTEIFFISKGNALFKIDDQEHEVSNNTLVIVDRGEVHSMKNLSDTENLEYFVFGISSGGKTTVVKNTY